MPTWEYVYAPGRSSRHHLGNPAAPFRFYFWQRLGDRPDAGWASEEWQVEDADVREVLGWADGDTVHRAYTLYVSCADGNRPGLIRLLGDEPTAIS